MSHSLYLALSAFASKHNKFRSRDLREFQTNYLKPTQTFDWNHFVVGAVCVCFCHFIWCNDDVLWLQQCKSNRTLLAFNRIEKWIRKAMKWKQKRRVQCTGAFTLRTNIYLIFVYSRDIFVWYVSCIRILTCGPFSGERMKYDRFLSCQINISDNNPKKKTMKRWKWRRMEHNREEKCKKLECVKCKRNNPEWWLLPWQKYQLSQSTATKSTVLQNIQTTTHTLAEGERLD